MCSCMGRRLSFGDVEEPKAKHFAQRHEGHGGGERHIHRVCVWTDRRTEGGCECGRLHPGSSLGHIILRVHLWLHVRLLTELNWCDLMVQQQQHWSLPASLSQHAHRKNKNKQIHSYTHLQLYSFIRKVQNELQCLEEGWLRLNSRWQIWWCSLSRSSSSPSAEQQQWRPNVPS